MPALIVLVVIVLVLLAGSRSNGWAVLAGCAGSLLALIIWSLLGHPALR